MKTLFTLSAIFACVSFASGQSVAGPTSVTLTSTATYTFSGSISASDANWVANKGQVVSATFTGGVHRAMVFWHTAGAGSVSIRSSTVTVATLPVTIVNCAIATPTVTNAWRCESGSVTLQATPGVGGNVVRWYASSSGGTFFTTGTSYTTPNLAVTTSYYVSTYNSSNGCETPRFTVTATINPSPSVPAANNAVICGGGAVTLSGSSGSNGNTLRWYDLSSGGSLLATGTSYTTPWIGSTTTYYISSYNSDTGCEGASRVPITATINAIPAAPTSNNGSSCGAGSVTLSAITGANGNAIRWYNASSGGTLLTTNSSYTTPSLSSNTTYYISSYNTTTGCESDRVSVLAVIYGMPGQPTGTNGSRNGQGPVSLSGTPGTTSTTLRWYNASTGGTLLATVGIYTTPSISVTTTYYISSYNAGTGCESIGPRVAVIATIHPVPSAPTGGNASRCGSGSVTLAGTPGVDGNTLRWYDASTGGTLLAAGTSYTTPSLSTTTTYYITSYNTGTGAESTTGRVALTATVNAEPAVPTASNSSRCGNGTVSLSGTPGANGNTLRWYDASSGGTLLTTNTTYTTPSLSSNTTYYISSYNTTTGCESTSARVAVAAIIFSMPEAPTASNHSGCQGTSVALSGIPGVNSTTLRWYNASTGGTLLATAGIYNTPNLNFNTTYYITSYNSGTGCESIAARIPVTATINAIPSVPNGTNAAICGPGSVSLSGVSGANGNTLRWYDASSGGTLLVTNTSYVPSISATTNYYISSYSSTTGCESATRTPVVATVNDIPAAPAGNNVSRCGEGVVTLSGTPGSGANTIRWYNSGGTWQTTNTSYITPNLNSNTTYYISSYNNSTGCESPSPRLSVTVTVNTLPGVPTAVGGSGCQGSTVQLSGTPGGYSTTLKWYDASSGGTLLATAGIYTTPVLSSSRTYYISSYHAGIGCESAERVPVTATIYMTIPSAPTGTSAAICGPGSASLSGASGTNGNTLRWYDAASGGPLLATSTSYTTPSINSTTIYYVSSYNTSTTCESTQRIPVTATVHPLPPVPAVDGNTRLGPGVLILNANGTPAGGTYNWYNPGNTLLATGSGYTTTAINSSQSNYLYAKSKSSALCESNPVWVTITIHTLPVIVATADRIVMGNSVTLDAVGEGFSSYTWKNNSGAIVSTEKTHTTNVPSAYTVTVAKNGVNGTGTTAPFRLKSQLEGLSMNYIVTNTVGIKDIKDADTVDDLPIESHTQDIQYFNGLGRHAQTVVTQASPLKNDIVQPVMYDALGREFRKYIPVVPHEDNGLFKADIIDPVTGDYSGIASDFYNNPAGQIADDENKPYSEIIFEPSPLNRIIKQGAPGSAWQPDNNNSYLSTDHTIKKAYETNGINEVLLFCNTSPDVTSLLGSLKLDFRSYYAANQLFRNRTKDEHGNETLEFIDKEGHVILKKAQLNATTYAQTYYVYDDLGNLVSMIQPEGVKNIVNKLSTSPWTTITGLSVDAAFNLTKTASGSYGNGAAVSLEVLGVGQDGWVEMTAQETDKSRMIGLAPSNVNHGTNIQYALELRNDGHVYVWENNVAGADLGSYSTGTVVRVAREGTEIKYYVNGIRKQTTTGVGNGTLLMDLAINHTGGTIKNVNFSFAVTTILQQALTNFAFRYAYDGRNRMTQKLIPGASIAYMVYDDRDRLVLNQDGNLRKNTAGTDLKQWLFTKYDAVNKPVQTGVYTADSVLSQSKMQARVDRYYNQLVSNNGAWYETFTSSAGHVHGYNNKSFPVVTDPLQYLSVTYYDDYSFKIILPDSSLYSFKSDELPGDQEASYFKRLNGRVTGTKVKVLDGGIAGGSTWLHTVSYFDDRYRVIQAASDNVTTGVDRSTNVYDFTRKILKAKTSHYARWKDLTGVSIVGNKITKTATAAGWGTAGAASIEKLPAGQNGWLEVTIAENNTARMIGFSDVNPDVNYQTIDYAIYLASGNLYIYENGVASLNKGLTASGDVLRIERAGTTIRYYKNGGLVHTSPTPSTTDLIVDLSLNTNGSTLSNIRASFTGLPKTITRSFSYDHAGRLLKTWHQIGQQPPVLLSSNIYNELGQLIDKKLHSTITDASDAKQSVDYRYNIRGWLTSINNAALEQDALTNDDTGDYFGFELAYNSDIGVGNSSLFNGNIAAMKWSNNLGLGSVKEKGHLYSYDAMNRILGATYKENNSGWNVALSNGFSESGYVYDLNGNIKSLIRYDKRGSAAPMDNLIYDYGTGTAATNKLLKVSEQASADAGDKFKGFVDGANTGNDYTYDNNGNLITDQNKGITSAITYNCLNLPYTVLRGGSSVTYVYDATGRKLTQLASFGNGTRTRTDYIGEFQYENSSLQFISHEEGRAMNSQNKLIYFHEGEVTADIAAINSTADLVTLNGGEKYVRVTANGTTAETGILPIGSTINVQQGERYKIRAKGYITGSSQVYLLVKTNNTNQNWLQSRLPAQASGESWIELEVIIPMGHTTLQAGLAWNTLTAGQQFFMNEFEIIKLSSNILAEYQYNLKDHLGNVRLTFTSKDETETSVATMETNHAGAEAGKYLYYDEAVKVNYDLLDHTNEGPTFYSTRLLGGSTNAVYGLARSLSVMPGDVINMEVYAKYLDPQTSNWNAALTNFMAAVASGSAPSGTMIDGGSAGSIGSQTFPYPGIFDHSTEGGTAPKAYLNFIVFDKDFNPIIPESGFFRITTAAKENGTDIPHERIFRPQPLQIKQPGYVYIFLSNESESPVEVYFDDFKVDHQKSAVIQTDDYYPFGLTFNSYTRENSTPQDYKYNGKEEQTELNLGWLDYGARMYQPEVGRFFTQDRFSEKYLDFTPYHYGANNPILYVDVNGDSLDLSNLSQEQRAVYDAQITKLSQNKLFKEYYGALQNSKTMYTFKAGAGKGGTGSFSPKTNEVSANLESTYGIAQELFHAFQSDLGVYTSADMSVVETEGDIVSGAVALSVDGLAMSEDWDQGIKFNYTNDNLEYNQKVLTKEFDSDFDKAVDARIDFYKKREVQDGAKAPATYIQKNSGVGALALKVLVKRLYPTRK